jgi:cell division protein FtsB
MRLTRQWLILLSWTLTNTAQRVEEVGKEIQQGRRFPFGCLH